MIKCYDISKSDTRYMAKIETEIIMILYAHEDYLVVNVEYTP